VWRLARKCSLYMTLRWEMSAFGSVSLWIQSACSNVSGFQSAGVYEFPMCAHASLRLWHRRARKVRLIGGVLAGLALLHVGQGGFGRSSEGHRRNFVMPSCGQTANDHTDHFRSAVLFSRLKTPARVTDTQKTLGIHRLFLCKPT